MNVCACSGKSGVIKVFVIPGFREITLYHMNDNIIVTIRPKTMYHRGNLSMPNSTPRYLT